MATYSQQVTTASATATTDLANIAAGVAATGDISTRTAVSNLSYVHATYDASGRAFIVGSVRTSASHIPGTTHGILNVGMMASALPFSGVALGTGRYYPLTFDSNGAVWVTPSGNTVVSAYLQASNNSIGSVVISGTAFIATATLTGLSAIYVTASGAVTANLTSGLQAFTRGSATATTHQGIVPMWHVDSAGTSGFNPANGVWGWAAVNASGHVYVKVTGNNIVSAYLQASGNSIGSVTISGTATIQGSASILSGQGAHNAATGGYPVRTSIHALAFNTTAQATTASASANNAVNWYGTTMGVPFIIGGAPNIQSIWMEVTGANSTSNGKLIDVAAGTKVVITEAGFTLGAAAAVNVPFKIGIVSASGATTLDTLASGVAGNLTAQQPVLQHSSVSPGGGIVRGNGGGIIAVGGDGCDVLTTYSAPGAGGKFSMWITYFTVPA